MPVSHAILLVDNGSLQPAPTLNLRRLAAALAAHIGRRVEPVSLLHSSGIDPSLLDGQPAEILEPAIRSRFAAGVREFLIVPLFFGPSAALTSYIPERVGALTASLPGLVVRLAGPLVDRVPPPDGCVAEMLADQVREVAGTRRISKPWVILVDHGSPQRAVAAVRDALSAQLAERLGQTASVVMPASMERREGADYDFNEPLLARALGRVEGPGVLAMLFFSPGRHAGPGGDIARICADAERERPGLRVYPTRLAGEHPRVVEILAERARAILHA